MADQEVGVEHPTRKRVLGTLRSGKRAREVLKQVLKRAREARIRAPALAAFTATNRRSTAIKPGAT
jgi:hypothetical protein